MKKKRKDLKIAILTLVTIFFMNFIFRNYFNKNLKFDFK